MLAGAVEGVMQQCSTVGFQVSVSITRIICFQNTAGHVHGTSKRGIF